ncbi:MAG: prolipoprotein diacylglyceryl transferase [bacterium]
MSTGPAGERFFEGGVVLRSGSIWLSRKRLCYSAAMRPILFSIGPLEISSYPVMISLGACLAIWLTVRELDRLSLARGPYLTICLIAFAGGLIGARIMNCIVFYDLYRDQPWWKLIAVWEGGLAMYGGLFLGLTAAYGYMRLKGLSFWQVTDVLFPPWVVLLIVGRIGCFLNGCCYGEPTSAPWGFYSRSAAKVSGYYVTTHPTQLYSAGAALVIFGILWRARLKPHFQGRTALLFLLLYPAARFVIEYYRADPRGMWRFFGAFTLSESQILSIPLFIAALAAWRVLSRHAPGERPEEALRSASVAEQRAKKAG